MANENVVSLKNVRIEIGPSLIFGASVIPFSNSVAVQQYSGSTIAVEIGGASLVHGQGFVVPATTPFSFPCTGSFYLCATGATAIVNLLYGLGTNP